MRTAARHSPGACLARLTRVMLCAQRCSMKKQWIRTVAVVGAALAACGADRSSPSVPTRDATAPTSTTCHPIPVVDGPVVKLTPADAARLPSVVREAAAGTTILLADGTYTIDNGSEGQNRVMFAQSGVTVRSESGRRDAVIIDAAYATESFFFIQSSGVTLADFTIRRATQHLVHVVPADGREVRGVRLHNMRLVDGGAQFVKINPAPGWTAFADQGEIACSEFEMTNAGREHVITAGDQRCYTGGVDAHAARDWRIHHNRFEGIYCTNGALAEHAVHFWSGSRDTVVENNVFLNVGRGVGFGLAEDGQSRHFDDAVVEGHVGHYGGVIRNNAIVATVPWMDTGIEVHQTRGARVYHNTVLNLAMGGPFYASISYRFANTEVDIRNNIAPRIRARNGAEGTLIGNLDEAPVSWFVNAAQGDVHLRRGAGAIDRGAPVDDPGLDIDGQTHSAGRAPDVGADEYVP